jgi:hypothetical protein
LEESELHQPLNRILYAEWGVSKNWSTYVQDYSAVRRGILAAEIFRRRGGIVIKREKKWRNRKKIEWFVFPHSRVRTPDLPPQLCPHDRTSILRTLPIPQERRDLSDRRQDTGYCRNEDASNLHCVQPVLRIPQVSLVAPKLGQGAVCIGRVKRARARCGMSRCALLRCSRRVM